MNRSIYRYDQNVFDSYVSALENSYYGGKMLVAFSDQDKPDLPDVCCLLLDITIYVTAGLGNIKFDLDDRELAIELSVYYDNNEKDAPEPPFLDTIPECLQEHCEVIISNRDIVKEMFILKLNDKVRDLYGYDYLVYALPRKGMFIKDIEPIVPMMSIPIYEKEYQQVKDDYEKTDRLTDRIYEWYRENDKIFATINTKRPEFSLD